jgi:hypothetical protein
LAHERRRMWFEDREILVARTAICQIIWHFAPVQIEAKQEDKDEALKSLAYQTMTVHGYPSRVFELRLSSSGSRKPFIFFLSRD